MEAACDDKQLYRNLMPPHHLTEVASEQNTVHLPVEALLLRSYRDLANIRSAHF